LSSKSRTISNVLENSAESDPPAAGTGAKRRGRRRRRRQSHLAGSTGNNEPKSQQDEISNATTSFGKCGSCQSIKNRSAAALNWNSNWKFETTKKKKKKKKKKKMAAQTKLESRPYNIESGNYHPEPSIHINKYQINQYSFGKDV